MVLPEEGRVGKEVQINRLQGAVRQAGEAEAAHLQRADVPVREAHLQPGELVAEKADVEGGVVGHQDAVCNEGAEERENLLRFGLAREHLVGDAMNRLYDRWDRDPGINQGREFPDDGTVFDGDRADLDDPVALSRRKPGRFDIDDHMTVKCAHSFFRGRKISRFPKRFLQRPEHVTESCGALPVNCTENRPPGTLEMRNPRVHGVANDLMGITSEIGAASFPPQSVL